MHTQGSNVLPIITITAMHHSSSCSSFIGSSVHLLSLSSHILLPFLSRIYFRRIVVNQDQKQFVHIHYQWLPFYSTTAL